MQLSRQFILRPVATTLLMVAIFLTGVLAYRLLPQSALPQVDYPIIQVLTRYPGANPDTVASTITAPLERQFGMMAGLKQMSSSSSTGLSLVTLQFALDISLDIAEQTVQAAINAAANLLPRDLPAPPVYSKVNPADAPVLTLAISSDALPLTAVQDLIETRLAQKIAQVSGVGLVSLSGGQRPAFRVQVNPQALAAYQLGFDQLRAAITAANSNQAKGSFDGPQQASTLDSNGQVRSAADLAELIIAQRNGAPVRLADVATVIDGAEDERLAAWADERPAILMNVQRQPGSNVIEVVDRIRALLPSLRETLPASVDVRVLTDRTDTIRASVDAVQVELLLAVGLVVLVIFLFLRSLPATVIPSFAVPLSLVGTFAVMYLAGFSINNLTLMALTIATGFVVDDAIVMIENIARHLERGESALQAALDGSRQIGFTIVSLTFSLLAVLIPLLFMGDIVGRLFREFAITLAVAILISAVVSLTLTPMLCARLLRRPDRAAHASQVPRRPGFFDRLLAAYGSALRIVLRHRWLTLAVAFGTLVLTVVLAIAVPKGFFPLQDTGVVLGQSVAPASISFAELAKRQQALASRILADPAVESLASFVGVDGVNTRTNTGRIQINLKPRDSRDASATAVISRLRATLADVEGIELFLQPVQDLTIDNRVGRTQFQYLLESADPGLLDDWTPCVLERLKGLPELADVAGGEQAGGLAADLRVDRDQAGRLGISMAAVDDALYSAFGQRQVATIFTQTNQYRVVLEVAPAFRTGPESLDAIHLKAAGGRMVPLATIASFAERPGKLAVEREQQFPSETISFNLAPGVSLGQAIDAIEAARQSLNLPTGLQTQFQGAALAFRAALDNELALIIAAIATMYLVLGLLYESYLHPLTILSTLPSAGVGALLALQVTGNDLSIIAIIGIILLIGIVQKNAIMMIDFALDAQREQGKPAEEAIYQACLLRLRPILMTTCAALLSALPLMLGTGVGSELRRPLGIVMAGGLMFSQVLTLFTTPVVYLAFERLGSAFRRWRGLERLVVEDRTDAPVLD